MMQDVVEVRFVKDKILYLRFDDGTEGNVDLAMHIKFTRIFAPLCDEKIFKSVFVNQEAGTICWPNDADLCPDTLYQWIEQNRKVA